MKKLIGIAVLALSGCMAQPILNQSGKPVVFSGPVLDSASIEHGHFVLLEKQITEGKYIVVSISGTRQPITNERQERIVFNQDVTKYAPDYTVYNFQIYVDQAYLTVRTPITLCGPKESKVAAYGPCSSDFAALYIPTSIQDAYVAGHMDYSIWQTWENPQINHRRMITSPRAALAQAGVFQHLADVANEQ